MRSLLKSFLKSHLSSSMCLLAFYLNSGFPHFRASTMVLLPQRMGKSVIAPLSNMTKNTWIDRKKRTLTSVTGDAAEMTTLSVVEEAD